jgi:hypothetical protein
MKKPIKKPIKKPKDILGPFSPFDTKEDKNRKRMEREDRLAQDKATQEGYSKGSAYQSRLAKGSPSAGTRGSRPQSANADLWQGATNNGYFFARKEMLNAKGRRRNEIGGGFGATKPRTPAAAAAGKAAKERGQRIKKAVKISNPRSEKSQLMKSGFAAFNSRKSNSPSASTREAMGDKQFKKFVEKQMAAEEIIRRAYKATKKK